MKIINKKSTGFWKQYILKLTTPLLINHLMLLRWKIIFLELTRAWRFK